ncbi:MAG: phosphate ABC transporter permease subunit PstC [Candidatus Marinimicrobia bacterium]|nr:phosphate ABC transporter permease subunit PstC [Candidatus Neomarinimicrobiota bacterium]
MKMTERSVVTDNKQAHIKEKVISGLLSLSALISVVTTVGIIILLLSESVSFFKEVSIIKFLFGTRWEPLLEPKSFGVLPLLSGTMLIVVGSAIIAIPMGLLTAIYLSQYASDRVRTFLKPILEILAGIPTIVYGYFALTFISPILKQVFPSTHIFNALSASIVVGIMILPMVASLCDDAIRAVPNTLKQGGYALGATPFEVITQVIIPGAFSGIMASFILAVSRAFGETMAVTLAAGATPNLTVNPLESIQTMTAYIVQVSLGDTPAGGIEYQTIFAVGALLFFVTLTMNVIANRVMHHFREVYE